MIYSIRNRSNRSPNPRTNTAMVPAQWTRESWWDRTGSNRRAPGFNRVLCLLSYGPRVTSVLAGTRTQNLFHIREMR